jgi:hypothetical protein
LATNPIFAQLVISLNLILAALRLGLKNRQVGEKWVSDDCSYLCKGLLGITFFQLVVNKMIISYNLISFSYINFMLFTQH